jgi:hypothetical protein
MARQRISQYVAAALVVLGIVAAADPELIPPLVQRWALLAASIVGGVAGALGFHTPPRPLPRNPDPRDLP